MFVTRHSTIALPGWRQERRDDAGDDATARADAPFSLWLLPIFGVAGVLSGLLGTGGASILIPALTDIARLPQPSRPCRRAGGDGCHDNRLGQLDPRLVARLFPAGIAGGVVGALAIGLLDPHVLRAAFAVFLLVAGARMARRR